MVPKREISSRIFLPPPFLNQRRAKFLCAVHIEYFPELSLCENILYECGTGGHTNSFIYWNFIFRFLTNFAFLTEFKFMRNSVCNKKMYFSCNKCYEKCIGVNSFSFDDVQDHIIRFLSPNSACSRYLNV